MRNRNSRFAVGFNQAKQTINNAFFANIPSSKRSGRRDSRQSPSNPKYSKNCTCLAFLDSEGEGNCSSYGRPWCYVDLSKVRNIHIFQLSN